MSDFNNLKISNNTDKVTGYRVRRFQYTQLGKIVLKRLMSNRDLKMLITSRGNTTGTGKSMLAIILARCITKYANDIFNNNIEWNAKDHSFIDVYEYLNKYRNSKKGAVLITDELEYLADKRRSPSNENVHFSQAWQMLRYENVVTIATAPSMANLDMRIGENIDIWINILYPGMAHVFYVTMDDLTGERIIKRLKQNGYRECLRWRPIDDDEDYKILTEKKREQGVPGIGQNNEKYDSEEVQKEKKETKVQTVEQITVNLLEKKQEGVLTMTQEDIANVVDRSQQYVSKVKREAL